MRFIKSTNTTGAIMTPNGITMFSIEIDWGKLTKYCGAKLQVFL